jgi:hypothetical protein
MANTSAWRRLSMGAALGSVVTAAALVLPGAVPSTSANPTYTGPRLHFRYTVAPQARLHLDGSYRLRVHMRASSDACAIDFWAHRNPGERGRYRFVERRPVAGRRFQVTRTIADGANGFDMKLYRVRAQGCDGAYGPVASSHGFLSSVNDDTRKYVFTPRAGTWTRVEDPDAFGGSYRQSTSGIGAKMRISGWWGPFGAVYGVTSPRGGIATIYIDGVKIGTKSFYSSERRTRVPVWTGPMAEGATIVFVATGRGSGGGAQIAFDGFVNPILD